MGVALAYTSLNPGPMTRASGRVSQRLGLLLILSAGLLGVSFLVASRQVQLALLVAGMTALSLALLSKALTALHRIRRQWTLDALAQAVAMDGAYTFFTDFEGEILFRNRAAEERCGARSDITLGGELKEILANPGSVLHRLKSRIGPGGTAGEEIVTRQGCIRLSVHAFARDGLLWRVEESAVTEKSPLATAMDHVPMVSLGRNNAVLQMNAAATELVGARIKALDRLILDLPLVSGGVHDISVADGVVRRLVICVQTNAGRSELFLLPEPKIAASDDAAAAFDALPVGLLKLSPNGALLRSNKEARALLGGDCAQSKLLSDYMEGLGRPLTDWIQETATGRGTNHSEFLRLTRADKEVFVQVTLNRITENGQTALIAVINDATELKTLEAQFVQSQKMQAIGQLAGGVAHDFNNLLTAISGHCDLLLLRHDQGDPDFGDLVQINQNANRAAALVGQLLAFSRKQTLRPVVLDLRDTLSDLTHLLNRLVGEKVVLELRHDPVLKPVRADKRQLEQVMMNLVVNARDAMPTGGRILIETEMKVLHQPMRRDRAEVAAGEYVSVKVTDDGVGIPPDKMQKVFEPFYTTKRTGEGTGLGLSTVYGIVKQTGGFIFVDSVVGSGTCFTLLLPASEVEMAVGALPRPVEKKPAIRHGDGVVLLVEDEAPVRAFASRALRLRGYTVLEAASAEDALKLLEDPTVEVDVFVTDVVMPGMDGPTWVREALKERPDVRVVFVSGYAEDVFRDSEARIPKSVFLPKPFSLGDLTETVHKQLSGATESN